MAQIPPATICSNWVAACAVIRSARHIRIPNSPTHGRARQIRSTSPITAKMKSVWSSGRKLLTVWVAPLTPLPSAPPEPIAVLLWVSW